MVKALLEQVSGLQEDVAVLDSQIDDLSGTKANKADIAVSVSTKSLGADTATIGEGTVNRLHSSEVDTNRLHATESHGDRPPNPRGGTGVGKKAGEIPKKIKKKQKKVEILLDTFPVRVYILSHRRR